MEHDVPEPLRVASAMHRGPSSINWPIAMGKNRTGLSIFWPNNGLDEGPIITQGMETVNHTYYPEDLTRKGKDIEAQTLARAVQYHAEKRIFLFNAQDDREI